MDTLTCKHELAHCATCAGLHDPYEPPVRTGTDKVRYEHDPTEVVRILAQPAYERGPAVTFTGQGEISTVPIPTGARWAPYVGGQRVSTTDRERRKLLAQGKRYAGPETSHLLAPKVEGTSTELTAAERIERGLQDALARLNAM